MLAGARCVSAEHLKARAVELRTMGQYIGMFDWVIWSIVRRALLFVLLGDNLVDVGAVFAPTLTVVDLDDDPRNGFIVIGCLATRRGLKRRARETTMCLV